MKILIKKIFAENFLKSFMSKTIYFINYLLLKLCFLNLAYLVTLESEEDAEHSSEGMDIPLHDAIKYLDPSTILQQFDENVRNTLKTQMCVVPNADSRIIASNELLKVLAEDKDARILNSLRYCLIIQKILQLRLENVREIINEI